MQEVPAREAGEMSKQDRWAAVEDARAQLAMVMKERDEARSDAAHYLADIEHLKHDVGAYRDERDAALARAEKAERERDSLKIQADDWGPLIDRLQARVRAAEAGPDARMVLHARVKELEYSLRIYIHAQSSGNMVPPHLEAQARAALCENKREGEG